MNKSWHAKHPMPRHATDEQRLAWHAQHARFCGCRPVPAALARRIRERQRPRVR